MNRSVIIVGDGWAALGAAAFLTKSGTSVIWVSGSGARLAAPLPSVETGSGLSGAEIWRDLAEQFEVDAGALVPGSFLREFRNKGFREPAWVKGASTDERCSVLQEILWGPESRLVPVFEARFELTLAEIENQIREELLNGEWKNLRRIEGVPLSAIRTEEDRVVGITLGTGEEISADRVIFADRWLNLGQIQGLPKSLSFTRRRDPMSVLQVAFTHKSPIGVGIQEGFFGPMHREAGEESDKHAWGYFSTDGIRSYWTLCMTGEEVEDNHAIAKKLRRLKSALDKMFTGESWLPAAANGAAEFMANVQEEQVRFEESVLFASGEILLDPVRLPKLEGLSFLTDGYGPGVAMHLVGAELGIRPVALDAGRSQSETVDVNAAEAVLG